ncbi:AraC family transcriptional regulator [Cohnella sp. REN36]|uniref:AraC family transcriptional regulator n=1 Tax=Cohnella sp. REN36 TaxID=2887347 RepID=UPI001D14B891|nr:AraC family transcriptional regulator [Cohnella sp. REN36]MCC3373344.1 AraC family transcriptional regulator [Cohnella sp. REN36]
MPNPPFIQWDRPIEMGHRSDHPMAAGSYHSHPFYEIYYFHEGLCTYLIGDKLITLSPGDLILMHGMTLHCPNPAPHVPYIRSTIHFDPAYVKTVVPEAAAESLLQPFEELRNVRLPLRDVAKDEAERLLAEMGRLYALVRSQTEESGGAYAYERFSLRFAELLYLIKGWCGTSGDERLHRSERERHVQRVISFLEERYQEPLTLDHVADALHLSKTYLSNLFKEVTGSTVFQFLYNRRLNQAKIQFKLNPQATVTEVAHSVGYTHLAHFSRHFKTAIGCTPEAYRRKMAEEAKDRPGAAWSPE